jgi:hypothetical protein
VLRVDCTTMIAAEGTGTGDQIAIATVLALIHLDMQATDDIHWSTFEQASSSVGAHIAGIRYGERSRFEPAKSRTATSPFALELQVLGLYGPWMGCLSHICRGSVVLSVIGASHHLPRISAPELRAGSTDFQARGHVLISRTGRDGGL